MSSLLHTGTSHNSEIRTPIRPMPMLTLGSLGIPTLSLTPWTAHGRLSMSAHAHVHLLHALPSLKPRPLSKIIPEHFPSRL